MSANPDYQVGDLWKIVSQNKALEMTHYSSTRHKKRSWSYLVLLRVALEL